MEYLGGYGEQDVYKCTREEYIQELKKGIVTEGYRVIADDGSKFVRGNMVWGVVNDCNKVISVQPREYLSEAELRQILWGERTKLSEDEVVGEKEWNNDALDALLTDAAVSFTIGGLDLEKVLTEYAVDV